MSSNDTTTNVSPDLTGLAVAVGRIEEGQKNLQTSVSRVEGKVDGVADTVAAHTATIAAMQTKIDAHDKFFEDIKPTRVPWPSIGAFIIAAAALGWAIAQQILITQ